MTEPDLLICTASGTQCKVHNHDIFCVDQIEYFEAPGLHITVLYYITEKLGYSLLDVLHKLEIDVNLTFFTHDYVE